MHLSVPSTGQGPAEVLRAAELAVAFAGPDPLILGGDLNLRPSSTRRVFEELERRFGLAGADRRRRPSTTCWCAASTVDDASRGPSTVTRGRCASPITRPSRPRSA